MTKNVPNLVTLYATSINHIIKKCNNNFDQN